MPDPDPKQELTAHDEHRIRSGSVSLVWFILGGLMSSWWPVTFYGLAAAFCVWFAFCWLAVIGERTPTTEEPE